jgi:hypothetical protein
MRTMNSTHLIFTAAVAFAAAVIAHAAPFNALHSFDFNTPGNAEGWAAGGGLTLLEVENGALTAEVSGTDPFTKKNPSEPVTSAGRSLSKRVT